jgi:hypothetical protein
VLDLRASAGGEQGSMSTACLSIVPETTSERVQESNALEQQRQEYLIRKTCVQVLLNHRAGPKEKLKAAKLLKEMIMREELSAKRMKAKSSQTKSVKSDGKGQLEQILSDTGT